MPRRARVAIAVSLGVMLLFGLGYCAFEIAGSVVVVDRTGEVAEAVATNDLVEQRLFPLPGGIFYAIPEVEGGVEIRCRDGRKHRWGYVTVHAHTRLEVHEACKLIEIH